jgi:hypothetical protein
MLNVVTSELLAPPLASEKQCPLCGTAEPSAFGVCASRPDGLNLYCRNCARGKVEETRAIERAARAAFEERLRRLPSKGTSQRTNPLSPTCKTCGAVATPAMKIWLRRGWQNRVSLAIARKRYHRKEGGKTCMGRAEDEATKLVKLPDRIAAIVGKTYAVMGDAWDEKKGGLYDDQALIMIQDLLEEYDATAITRNKDKRLIRR